MVMVTTVNTYKYHAGKNGQRSWEQDGDGSFDYIWLLNVMFVEYRLNRVKSVGFGQSVRGLLEYVCVRTS